MPRAVWPARGRDLVLCFGILHPVTNAIGWLRVLAGVLAPRGEMVLETYGSRMAAGGEYVCDAQWSRPSSARPQRNATSYADRGGSGCHSAPALQHSGAADGPDQFRHRDGVALSATVAATYAC